MLHQTLWEEISIEFKGSIAKELTGALEEGTVKVRMCPPAPQRKAESHLTKLTQIQEATFQQILTMNKVFLPIYWNKKTDYKVMNKTFEGFKEVP